MSGPRGVVLTEASIAAMRDTHLDRLWAAYEVNGISIRPWTAYRVAEKRRLLIDHLPAYLERTRARITHDPDTDPNG